MVFYVPNWRTLIHEASEFDSFGCGGSEWNLKGLCLSTLSYFPLTLLRLVPSCAAPGVGRRSERKLNKRTTKMTHVLSRTMSLIGVAFLIHFIIMSTFAENSGRSRGPGTESEGDSIQESRRRPRSYRADRDNLSPGLGNIHGHGGTPSNLVGLGSGPPLSPHPQRPPPSDKSEAIFTTENSTLVTAQEGSTANLPCIVRNLGNGVASWMRRRDYSLLTVGMGTITHDDRFYVSHSRTTQNWELHIKYVKATDEGTYECQISTHPPTSIYITLRVVEARAEILGEPDKHVRSGSTFELVCVLRESTEPPTFVFWYHNDRMINYDSVRGVVVNNDAEKSVLIIEDAQKNDSGNYTCTPSNARPTSISVHILNGEKPAAMQHGSQSHSTKLMGSSWIFVLLLTSTVLSISLFPATYSTNQRRLVNAQNFNSAKFGFSATSKLSQHQKRPNPPIPKVFQISTLDAETAIELQSRIQILNFSSSAESFSSPTKYPPSKGFSPPLIER